MDSPPSPPHPNPFILKFGFLATLGAGDPLPLPTSAFLAKRLDYLLNYASTVTKTLSAKARGTRSAGPDIRLVNYIYSD